MRFVPLLLLAVVAAPALAQDLPAVPVPKWEAKFVGIEMTPLAVEKPRLMKGHAVRIDLTADGISFLATPPMADKPTLTAGLKTSTFLEKHRCQLAINAGPFGPVKNDEGFEATVSGPHVSNGKLVSKGAKYDALFIAKDNAAAVQSPPFKLDDAHTVVGGFSVVLKGGKLPELIADFNKGPLHPRTAAGVSKDGKTLILLVIDGRQKEFSDGATVGEVGLWLKALGAADGINLDGGGTTTLVVADDQGKASVINKPIHLGKPGTERPSGSHLGVFAKPLSAK